MSLESLGGSHSGSVVAPARLTPPWTIFSCPTRVQPFKFPARRAAAARAWAGGAPPHPVPRRVPVAPAPTANLKACRAGPAPRPRPTPSRRPRPTRRHGRAGPGHQVMNRPSPSRTIAVPAMPPMLTTTGPGAGGDGHQVLSWPMMAAASESVLVAAAIKFSGLPFRSRSPSQSELSPPAQPLQ
jgi:hypothetical protein